MKKLLKNLAKVAISILILGIIIYRIGVGSILEELKKIDFIFIIFSALIFFIILIVSAINIKLLTDPVKKLPFWKILKYSILGWAAGLFFIGKIGEFSLVYFLKKDNIPLGKGFAITLLDKIITFASISLIAVLGFLYFFDILDTLKLAAILIVILAASMFFILNSKTRALIRKYILRKHDKNLTGFSKTIFTLLKKTHIIMFNFLMTFVKWLLTAAIYYLLFLGLGVTVPITAIIIIEAITIIVSLIPISMNGLGLRESAGIYLFSLVNIKPEITAAMYVLFIGIIYIMGSISILFLDDLFKKNTKDRR